MENYIEINKHAWNTKLDSHLKSDFYDIESFKKGKSSLNEIELDLLGDIKDRKILHLQCHFGQDTLSLARMGADVTGVDLSDRAIKTANELSNELNVNARFIESDILKLSEVHSEKYDIVFASYGVLGWHPTAKKWFNEASKFVKPGGKLILVEFHPIIWIHDGAMENIVYSWFNDEEIVDESEGTYADKEAKIKYQEVGWNHSLEDIFMGAIESGFKINSYKEYNYSPYECFAGLEEFEKGKYFFKKHGKKIPMVYSLVLDK